MDNNGNMRTSVEPNKIYIVGNVLMRAIQNVILIEFEPLCQTLWTFMLNLPKSLTKLWSFHVTLASNSENYFSPNSVSKFRKSYQISGKLAQKQKVTGKKQIEGGKHIKWFRYQ